MNDPYAALGVSSSATDEEISRAYKKLARQFHPDLNPGDKHAEVRMKEINAAYDSIKDMRSGKSSSRAYERAYGSTGTYYGDTGRQTYTDPFGSYRRNTEYRYYGFDFGDLFGSRSGNDKQDGRPTGLFGFFGSFIRFSLLLVLLRFIMSVFFFPIF